MGQASGIRRRWCNHGNGSGPLNVAAADRSGSPLVDTVPVSVADGVTSSAASKSSSSLFDSGLELTDDTSVQSNGNSVV